jgi:hypothetical protein
MMGLRLQLLWDEITAFEAMLGDALDASAATRQIPVAPI